MIMIKLNKETREQLLDIFRTKRVGMEGSNLLKLIEDDKDDTEFNLYLEASKKLDEETRRKRLDITKQIQAQNRELTQAQGENTKLMAELTVALIEAEKLRDAAVEDLDTLHKRSQFELIGLIVKIALGLIIGVGVVTSGLYVYAMATGNDTKILESTWSNMFGILLTNSFSIIGTIMGVKYATGSHNTNNNNSNKT